MKKPEPPRQKSSLKNARKEYPTFDINLRVAVEFLGRLKSGETRGLFVFQQQSEEYSPWKVVDIPTEKRESKEDRPTTFAQAVMVKQNTANGSAGGLDAAKGACSQKAVPQNTILIPICCRPSEAETGRSSFKRGSMSMEDEQECTEGACKCGSGVRQAITELRVVATIRKRDYTQ